MEYILVLLIVALLNGAIAYIDGLMEGIIPLTLYAEQYMSTLAGVDLFQSLFDIVFGFGVRGCERRGTTATVHRRCESGYG